MVLNQHNSIEHGSTLGWWLGLAVTHFIRSTKFFYAGPG